MSTATINFKMVDLDGTVIPLTKFAITSGRPNVGAIPPTIPARVEFTTDSEGLATVALEASLTVPYYIQKVDYATDSVINYKFFVPPSNVPLSSELLYVDLGKHFKPYNDKSLAALIEAKVVAVNAANQALSVVSILGNLDAFRDNLDNIVSVAENLDDVVAVADNNANITTVASNSTNINTVAANIANVNTVSNNAAYLPFLEESVNAIDQAVDGIKDLFIAGTHYTKDITTQLTLSSNPAKANNVKVFFNGVYQNKDTFSRAGSVITFSDPIPSDSVEVHYEIASQFVGLNSEETAQVATALNAATVLRNDLASGDLEKGSALVYYMPVGTGAVSTTVQRKLREFVSVKDFGAVGDGVTDDTAAIQAALSYSVMVKGVSDDVYKLTSPVYITTANSGFVGNGCEIQQTTAGEPAFIISSDNVTIKNTSITNTAAKPGTGTSGPYRAGVVYHSGVLQTAGDYLTVKNCVFTDWTAGVGFHGAQDLVTRAKSLKIIGNTFIRHDFGALIRQFEGADFSSNVGYDCEETVEPGHLLYVTDRGTIQSRNLTVVGNREENNTTADSIKIRNVKGFSIANNIAINCVRGIYVGFSEKGVVSGNIVSDLQQRASDTSATGLSVEDCFGVELLGNVIDIGASGASGIRVRSDVGTYGNREIISNNNTIYFDGTTSKPTPYRVSDQTDFLSSSDVFVNTGTDHSRYAFRLYSTTRATILSPVLKSDTAISNAHKILEVDAGCTNTKIFVNATAWPTWNSVNSISDAGTNTVIRSTTSILADAGSVSAPSITFSASPTTGLYRGSTGVLGIAVSGVNTVTVTNSRVDPGADNTFNLGATDKRWRTLHIFNVRTHGVTVADLASISGRGAGARAFVTDATATTFGSIVAGGGSNSVPVYDDGTNWRIG